jgi:hypothetical protein
MISQLGRALQQPRMQIKDNFYKIRISLKDVDEELDAKETTIYIRRLNND